MRFLRIGICALIAIGVLAHGGVEDWARAIFETGAALLFLGWVIRVYLRKEETAEISPLLPPLAGLLVVVLVQMVFRRTASMYDTRQEFALLLADVLVVFLAVQAYRTLEEWRGFVWFVMIFGFLVSIFGLLQHLTFNGKLYWFRTMHYGGIPFGPYVNRNHFAGFAELFIPLALVPLMLGKVRRERWFDRGSVCGGVDRELVSGGIAGRDHQFCGGSGDHRGVDERAANGKETGAGGSGGAGGGGVDGVVAGSKRDSPAVYDDEVVGGSYWKACFDAPGHLENIHGPPVDGNGAGYAGGGLSSV